MQKIKWTMDNFGRRTAMVNGVSVQVFKSVETVHHTIIFKNRDFASSRKETTWTAIIDGRIVAGLNSMNHAKEKAIECAQKGK